MIAQQNGDWCWLACAQMCMSYGHAGQSYSQEQLLEFGYGLPAGACSNDNPRCNIPGTAQQIQTLLQTAGNQSSSLTGPLDPGQVRDELADKHPIVIFLRTSPTIGHFVVVSGIFPANTDGSPTLVLNDPYFGKLEMPYQKVRGLWEQSLVVA